MENSMLSCTAGANVNRYSRSGNNSAAWLTIKIHFPLAQ